MSRRPTIGERHIDFLVWLGAEPPTQEEKEALLQDWNRAVFWGVRLFIILPIALVGLILYRESHQVQVIPFDPYCVICADVPLIGTPGTPDCSALPFACGRRAKSTPTLTGTPSSTPTPTPTVTITAVPVSDFGGPENSVGNNQPLSPLLLGGILAGILVTLALIIALVLFLRKSQKTVQPIPEPAPHSVQVSEKPKIEEPVQTKEPVKVTMETRAPVSVEEEMKVRETEEPQELEALSQELILVKQKGIKAVKRELEAVKQKLEELDIPRLEGLKQELATIKPEALELQELEKLYHQLTGLKKELEGIHPEDYPGDSIYVRRKKDTGLSHHEHEIEY